MEHYVGRVHRFLKMDGKTSLERFPIEWQGIFFQIIDCTTISTTTQFKDTMDFERNATEITDHWTSTSNYVRLVDLSLKFLHAFLSI